jgi:hypothetical protein
MELDSERAPDSEMAPNVKVLAEPVEVLPYSDEAMHEKVPCKIKRETKKKLLPLESNPGHTTQT